MIRTVITLLVHDLAVAFKNKTVYLVFCIPLFVCVTFALVDSTDARAKIALIKTELYAPVVIKSLDQATDEYDVRWVSNEAEATRLLKERDVGGILTCDAKDKSRLSLTVVDQASVETLNLLQRFSALQAAAEGTGPGWIASVRSLQAGSVIRQSLPTWILMMVLLVSFIVLPAQVAEEKEKQLLLGWMQTPVRESEWVISKLAYGLILMLASVTALQLMSRETACAHEAGYLAMLCAGGFCFGSLGICLGLACRTQASARTMGVLSYLPLLLPAALSDQSHELRSVAPLLPSYHFYEPLRAMLLDGAGPGAFARAWISLAAIGVVACLVSHRLIRRRWLM